MPVTLERGSVTIFRVLFVTELLLRVHGLQCYMCMYAEFRAAYGLLSWDLDDIVISSDIVDPYCSTDPRRIVTCASTDVCGVLMGEFTSAPSSILGSSVTGRGVMRGCVNGFDFGYADRCWFTEQVAVFTSIFLSTNDLGSSLLVHGETCTCARDYCGLPCSGSWAGNTCLDSWVIAVIVVSIVVFFCIIIIITFMRYRRIRRGSLQVTVMPTHTMREETRNYSAPPPVYTIPVYRAPDAPPPKVQVVTQPYSYHVDSRAPNINRSNSALDPSSNSALAQTNAALVQTNSALVQSNSALVQANQNLAQSNSALVNSAADTTRSTPNERNEQNKPGESGKNNLQAGNYSYYTNREEREKSLSPIPQTRNKYEDMEHELEKDTKTYRNVTAEASEERYTQLSLDKEADLKQFKSDAINNGFKIDDDYENTYSVTDN
jgi:hypothetical protein